MHTRVCLDTKIMLGIRCRLHRPKTTNTILFTAAVILFGGLVLPTASEVVQLTAGNLDNILANNELVFVNFYADWCRFSQMLAPIFQEASNKVTELFPQEGKVVFGKIDCDREAALAVRYQVSKYPTLKIFRFGNVVKREYRGQRSVDAFANFIGDQLSNPISMVTNLDDLEALDWQKRHIIGYYDSDQSNDLKVFMRVASVLRHDCKFHVAVGPMTAKERFAGNKIVYRPAIETEKEMTYSGSTGDHALLLRWTTDKCVPLVRELTFENAEEMTEEGLPFLILFHDPDDYSTPERFKKQVSMELLPERSSVNFLTADGKKFTHPLNHLGKSQNDLPVLAIDSFKHMYIWGRDPKFDIDTPGLLKQFVADLKSEKLHREFHNGPDPTTPTPPHVKDEEEEEKGNEDGVDAAEHVAKEDETTEGETKEKQQQEQPTSPPESLFKKLAPSRTRYTILRDEL